MTVNGAIAIIYVAIFLIGGILGIAAAIHPLAGFIAGVVIGAAVLLSVKVAVRTVNSEGSASVMSQQLARNMKTLISEDEMNKPLLHAKEELETANPGLKFRVSDEPTKRKVEFSGFKPGTYHLPQENDLRPCVEGKLHCWHSSPIQHAMIYHHDEICCWCGQGKCVSLPRSTPEGHGQCCPIPIR